MLKDNILRKVNQSLSTGELGLARQQLLSLINLFPYDLSLRRRLGDVYHRLQYPERAGCYWFLEEKKTPEMERACAAFAKSCGNHPFVLLRTLKFRGGSDSLPPGYARGVLEDLRSRAPDYTFPAIKSAQIAAKKTDTVAARVANTLIGFGCILFAIAVVAIFATGLVAIFWNGREYFLEIVDTLT